MHLFKPGNILLSMALFLFMPAMMAQDAHDLLAKLDNVMFSPKDKQGRISIILIDKAGSEKVREAEMFQKGRYHKLYRFFS